MRILYTLLKPFKYLVVRLFILVSLTAFLESFGLALLLPIIDLILNQESPSQLGRIITIPLDLMGLSNNIQSIAIFFNNNYNNKKYCKSFFCIF